MRPSLVAAVALAIAALFIAVVVFVPSAPDATIGALPLGVGSFHPSLTGTYLAPCESGTLPIWWAVYQYQSNRPNTTFHLSGAWTATRPTYVSFGFSTNLTSPYVLQDWYLYVHSCPLIGPNDTRPSPVPPALPTSGSVDYDVTTLPDATLFLLVVRTFDPADVVHVTAPFEATPV